MNTGLFAGLARRALQATALRARLPARYESAAAGADPTAAALPEPAAPASAPPPAPWGHSTAASAARAPAALDVTATRPEPPADIAAVDAALGVATRVAAPAPTAFGFETASGNRRRPALHDHREWPDEAVPRLEIPPMRRSPVDAMPLNTEPALATPAAPPAALPAAQTPGRPTEPSPPHSAASAGHAADLALALRERMAQQVPRLLDDHWPARPGGDTSPVAPASRAASPAAHRVDITIGSIAIVLTQAAAAAPARAAAPAAGPAVQSLDAYLQARQRRGTR